MRTSRLLVGILTSGSFVIAACSSSEAGSPVDAPDAGSPAADASTTPALPAADAATPVDASTGPRVKGTVTVKGSLAPRGQTPTPFTSSTAYDAAPAPAFADMGCNRVLVQRALDGGPKLRLTLRLCSTKDSSYVPVLLTFDVPVVNGTTTGPHASATLGEVDASTLKEYGDFRHKKTATGISVTIENASGVQTNNVISVGHLGLHLTGPLDVSTNPSDICSSGSTGSGCGEAGPTIDLDVDLELDDVTNT